MTEIGSVGGALMSRLFALADKDRDNSVSGAEMSALLESVGQKSRAETIMAAQDGNGDGALGADEWPTKLLSDETIGQLLSAQDYKALSAEGRAALTQQAKDAYFARADVDGNGVLSRDEIAADRAMNEANYLDSGALPNVAMMFRAGADQNAITKDDILVGQRLDMSGIEPMKPEDMDASLKEAFARAQRIVTTYPEDNKPADEAASAAPVAETPEDMRQRVSSAEFTTALLSRLMAQFGRVAAPGGDEGSSAA